TDVYSRLAVRRLEGLILRRREAPSRRPHPEELGARFARRASRRMAAGSVSLASMLRLGRVWLS
ncbi:MAG: hypothetical protein WAV78_32575, partial [Xanthobacteraceae bacterium]